MRQSLKPPVTISWVSVAVSTNTKWAFTGVVIHTASFGRNKTKKNIKTLFPTELHDHQSFFPSGSLRATSNKASKYLFILKRVSSTNEVNGITHMLRVKHVLCWIRATDLSNLLGWAVDMGYIKITVLCPDIAIVDSFCTEHLWLPISIYYFTLWLSFLLCYSWQVRPNYLLTRIIWYTSRQKIIIKIHIKEYFHCIFNFFAHSFTALANKWQSLNSK